jgi:hypothetical protein
MRTSLVFLIAVGAWLALAGTAPADAPQGHRAQLAPPDLVERYVASGRGQSDLIERWVDARAGRPGLTPAPAPDATTSAGSGFGRSHAGAGALTALVLTLAAAGGVLYLRRRDRRAHAPRPAVQSD